MTRWLWVLGGVVLALLVVLVVVVREDPRSPVPHDAGSAPVVRGSQPIAHPLEHHSVDAGAAVDASPDRAARDERETLLAGIRTSGSGVESWDTQGTTLLSSLTGGGVEVRDLACYVAGCSVTYTFPSEREYQRRIAELEASEGYRAWTGGKRLSVPEHRPDGAIVVALLLYRPD